MADELEDPFSGGMGTAATGLHEMYDSLRLAGFTEVQALTLVGQMLCAMVTSQQ